MIRTFLQTGGPLLIAFMGGIIMEALKGLV